VIDRSPATATPPGPAATGPASPDAEPPTFPDIDALLAQIAARADAAPNRVALAETTGKTLAYGPLWARVERTAAGLRSAGLAPGEPVAFMVRPSIAAVVLILALLRVRAVLVAADPAAGEAVFAARMARLAPRWIIAESPCFPIGRCSPLRRLLRRRGVALPDLAPLLAARPTGPPDWGFGPRAAVDRDAPAKRTPDVRGGPPDRSLGVVGVIAVGPWLPGVPRRALSATRLAAWSPPRAGNNGPPDPAGTPATDRPTDHRSTDQSPDRPAMVVFTSGTTADPRAVVHGARSIGAAVGMLAGQLDLGPDDAVFSGEMHLILPALLAGARAILPPPRALPPDRTLALLAANGATHLFAVPSAFDALCATALAAGGRLPESLRVVLLGSAPVTTALLARCRPALAPSTRVICAYAMTEILPVAAATLAEKLAHAASGAAGDLVGAPLPGVRARIDVDGELLLSGPNLCLGYLGPARRDGDPPAPTMTEHRTGDLASLDDAGRIILAGRSKDMILRRGHNVYPGLVEGPIAAIPSVRACALIGLPTADATDERIVLVVEPEDGAPADLARRVAAALRSGPHELDPGALPDAVVCATLPRAGRSHKIDRAAVRALAARLAPPDEAVPQATATPGVEPTGGRR